MTNRVLTRPRVAEGEGIRRLRYDPPNCLGRLLLAELTHRTLNDLTIAIGIVQLAAWHCPVSEEKSALSQSGTRLENLAKLQQVLLPPNHDMPIDVGPYIAVLCEAIAQSQLNHRRIELLPDIAEIRLSSIQCWLMGMIVTELIVNSARHAFGPNPGTIHLDISRGGRLIRCTVRDDGVGGVSSQPGTGTRIVESLAGHLEGSLKREFAAKGSTATVSFPARLLFGPMIS
jgi:two-component sensor histidine kinase